MRPTPEALADDIQKLRECLLKGLEQLSALRRAVPVLEAAEKAVRAAAPGSWWEGSRVAVHVTHRWPYTHTHPLCTPLPWSVPCVAEGAL
jgi:hypothetical protein